MAGCVVLGILRFHWLPRAVREWSKSEQRVQDLQTLASIDPLTGVYNRRQFETLAQSELSRSQRYMRPLSFLIIDIDHFARVNDQFGHEIGDWVLKMVATTITSANRNSDLVEFALMLPESTRDRTYRRRTNTGHGARQCYRDRAGQIEPDGQHRDR